MQAFVKLSATEGIAPADVARPSIDEHELLVRIAAIGVGIHDEYFLPPNLSYPYVIGIEGAGTVEQAGVAVAGFVPGDRIAFVSSMQAKGGTWGAYAAVAADSLIARVPEAMTFEAAAALPVAASTALKAFRVLNVQPGDTVFVAGATGAIGTLAVQIAVARGLRVVASASAKNHDYLLGLGAEKAVDYHDDDWHEQVTRWQPGGVAAAIAIQPGTASDSEPIVRDGGTIVAVSGDQHIPGRAIVVEQIPYAADVTDELVQLLDDVATGAIRQTVAIYAFSDALSALDQVRTRHSRGKLVVTGPAS